MKVYELYDEDDNFVTAYKDEDHADKAVARSKRFGKRRTIKVVTIKHKDLGQHLEDKMRR